jgi:hypothetical protein
LCEREEQAEELLRAGLSPAAEARLPGLTKPAGVTQPAISRRVVPVPVEAAVEELSKDQAAMFC